MDIAVDVSPKCFEFAKSIGISIPEIQESVCFPHQTNYGQSRIRYLSAKEFSKTNIIFIDGILSPWESPLPQGAKTLITVVVAIRLSRSLPSGGVDMGMEIEDILAHAADSFGVPLRMDSNEPFSTLYSGPMNTKDPEFLLSDPTRAIDVLLCGERELTMKYAERVWALDLEKYRAWQSRQVEHGNT